MTTATPSHRQRAVHTAAAILLGLLLAQALPAQQREVRTLDRLLTDAEQRHESIEQQRLTIEQLQKGEDAARAARLPRVDLTATYAHVSEVGSISFSIPGLISRTMQFGDGNIYETAVTASMPLFTGFRLQHAVAQQEQQRIAGEHALAATIADIRTAVHMQYRIAQLARTSEEILRTQQDLLRQLLNLRAKLVAQAQALPLDTLQLATRISQLDVDRATASSAYERAILLLVQLTGSSERFDVATFEGVRDGLELQSESELVRLAFETRPELQALSAQRSAGEHAGEMARASLYPTVAATASWKYGRPGVDQLRNEWMDYYTAAVRFEWNLWNWGSDKSQIERAELELRKTDARTRQLQTQIRTAIGLAREELAVRRTTLAMLEQQIALEQQRLAQTQARLREGMATTTDVVDVETALTTALLRREQTRIEYVMRQTELAAAVGVTE
jgi:outer membrane protein